MKKVLGVVVVLILVSSIGFGQMAFKGGLSMAKFRGDDAAVDAPEVAKYRTGFVAGVSYNMGLLLGLSIQPEVLYVQRGAMNEITVTGVSGKQTSKYDYVEIPVLVKFAPLPIPVIKPYVEAGVSYSILLGAKVVSEGIYAEVFPAELDAKEFLQKGDLSYILGAGIDLSLGLIGINVDARYVMGSKGLSKTYPDLKVYNQSIQVTAGLSL